MCDGGVGGSRRDEGRDGGRAGKKFVYDRFILQNTYHSAWRLGISTERSLYSKTPQPPSEGDLCSLNSVL